MSSLETKFAGLNLRNPIIAASAPPTETLENICRCADAGVGAVITKTCAVFNPQNHIKGGRRTYVDNRGTWAQGTFRRETLTLNDASKMIIGAKRETDIPIIASVGALGLDVENWLNACKVVEDSGADMIQLDLFYVPQPRASIENLEKLAFLIQNLSESIMIPIGPKINLDFPPYLVAEFLKGLNIDAVFLIDSIRVPPPIDIKKQGLSKIPFLDGVSECSLFGSWQKPITMQYISILQDKLDVPICAGGGLVNGNDAIEALMLGATTVQFATSIIENGFEQITKITKRLKQFINETHEYEKISEIVGLFQKKNYGDKEITFHDAKVLLDDDVCVRCGICDRLVFCQAISSMEDGMVIINTSCDGCGYCAYQCPLPGALKVQPL